MGTDLFQLVDQDSQALQYDPTSPLFLLMIPPRSFHQNHSFHFLADVLTRQAAGFHAQGLIFRNHLLQPKQQILPVEFRHPSPKDYVIGHFELISSVHLEFYV